MTDPDVHPGDLYFGDRVVIRYRLPDGRRTDVTGLLRDVGAALLVDGTGPKNNGHRIEVPRADVASIRLLSYRTVRNSEIRQVSAAAARASAPVRADVGDWLLRAGSDAPLNNSAFPSGVHARADVGSLTAISRWYAAAGLPPVLAVPERLLPEAHTLGSSIGPPTHLLVRPDDLSDVVAVDATDRERGAALRSQGYRLHHVMRHRLLPAADPGTYGRS